MSREKPCWITQAGYSNATLSADDLFISHNPRPPASRSEETALHIRGEDGGRGTYLILNGDFRDEYEAAFPDKGACLAVYEKHKAKHRSSWSEDKIDASDVATIIDYVIGGDLARDFAKMSALKIREDNQ